MRDLFVARQPIFDSRNDIAAYELLYRASADAMSAGGPVPEDRMAGSVIVDALLAIGLSKITEGHPAFVNVSEAILLQGFGPVLDPGTVVVELLESVGPTPDVLAACRDLRARGFRIALDDHTHLSGPGPLLGLADIVKVDVLACGDHLEEVVARLRPAGVRLLAEKVEDAAMHQRCQRMGFELFQGFHFLRPETVRGRDLDGTTAAILRLLSMLGDATVTERAVEEAFRADPALSYKLLRIVNSAAVGGRDVESLGHAMRLVGRDPLQRWLALLLLASGRGGGHARLELVKSALLRGRMCELLGGLSHPATRPEVPQGGTLFMVGLLSHLDVLLGLEMGSVLDDINVSREVREALGSRQGGAGLLLDAVVSFGDGEWDRARGRLAEVGLPIEALGAAYLDSLAWAGAHMALHESTS
jgi:EAL and modified HD-GYP domain-containing signal transduction protein